MKIAITGGAGFLGKHLQASLESAGHQCVIIDPKHSTPIDILDFPALVDAMEGCDAIYHLAAEHRDDVFPRSRYYDVNVKGTRYVANAADKLGINRIIFTSSFAVYGLNAHTPNELSQPAPFNDYGASKWEGEQVLRDWTVYNKKANLTVVRPVVVFGEGNRGNVHNLIRQIATNKFIMIGDGSNRKSMAYVGNVAAFLHFLLDRNEPGAIYNYADKPDYSMTELVNFTCDTLERERPKFALPFAVGLGAGYAFDALARISGKKLPISAVRVHKFCADTTCSAEKARRIGFEPPFTMEEGLRRFIQHDFMEEKQAA